MWIFQVLKFEKMEVPSETKIRHFVVQNTHKMYLPNRQQTFS